MRALKASVLSLLVVWALAQPASAASLFVLGIDESSGAAFDASGRGHSIFMPEGAVAVSGDLTPEGQRAFSFSGANSLEVAKSGDFVFGANEEFTFSFWFRSHGVGDRPPDYGYEDAMYAAGFGASLSQNLEFDFDDKDAGGRGVWAFWSGNGGASIVSAGGTMGLYTDGLWHKYVFTRSGSTITLAIYTPDADSPLAGWKTIGTASYSGLLGSDAAPWYIGRSSQGMDSYVRGLDDPSGRFYWVGEIGGFTITDATDPLEDPILVTVPEPGGLAFLALAGCALGLGERARRAGAAR